MVEYLTIKGAPNRDQMLRWMHDDTRRDRISKKFVYDIWVYVIYKTIIHEHLSACENWDPKVEA